MNTHTAPRPLRSTRVCRAALLSLCLTMLAACAFVAPTAPEPPDWPRVPVNISAPSLPGH